MIEYIDYCEKCGSAVECLTKVENEIVLGRIPHEMHNIMSDPVNSKCQGRIIHSVIE